MENDFQNILRLFAKPETQHISEGYLKKYWLNEEEWQSYWQPLKDKIFRSASTSLPNIMFNEGFSLMAFIRGVVFTEDDFQLLQRCMREVGEKEFVLVENSAVRSSIENDSFPYLRFKFPVDITWSELNNQDENYYDISFEIFKMMDKEFFVFGNSANWGKYAANEYWDRSVEPVGTPLDIIGFKPALAPVFKKNFEQPKGEREEIYEWLPQEYKKLIKQ